MFDISVLKDSRQRKEQLLGVGVGGLVRDRLKLALNGKLLDRVVAVREERGSWRLGILSR